MKSTSQVFIANSTATPYLQDDYSPYSPANIFLNNSGSSIQSILKVLFSNRQHRDDHVTLAKSTVDVTGKSIVTKNYTEKTEMKFDGVKSANEVQLFNGTAVEIKDKNGSTVTQTRKMLYVIKNSKSNEQLNQFKKPKAVIIVSNKRSGSSFVGEFFNRHPDAYYTFEPLHTVSDFARKNRLSNKDFLRTSLSVINGSFYCDFHNKDIARFASEKFCVSNLKLFKKQLCRHGYTESPPSAAKIAVWEQECRKYKMVVIKLIRINNLEDLKPLLSEIDLEWRIIYLVRDPRPTELSRKGSGRNYDLIRRKGTDRNDEVDLCQTLQQNLKFWVDTPSWLQGRFRMIRFEDIAASPLKKAKELLEFVGLDLADDVAKWIKENTEHEKRSLIKQREFSTSRNTSKVLENWRLKMDWTLVQRIQHVCSVPMRSLGYALMSNILSLRDLNVPSTVSKLTL